VSKFCAGLLLAALCLGIAGCNPSGGGALGEEREPHFLSGRRRSEQADYAGAAESFEQALQNNPDSGAAHFELGLIFYDKLNDPAAAIYHFQRFLKLRPTSNKADSAKQFISVCKQELVKEVPFNAVNQQMQRELERLTRENGEMRQQVEQLRIVAAQQAAAASNTALAQSLIQPAPQPGAAPAARPQGASPAPRPAATAPSPARTHVVKSGETPSSIARQYGVSANALMAANPNLDARRMKIGQTLTIPGR